MRPGGPERPRSSSCRPDPDRGLHRSWGCVGLKELIEASKVTPVINRTHPLRETHQAIDHAGARHARGEVAYLVSPRGETHWARNLRAAGEADLRARRHLEHVRVVELHGAERDAVVKTYASTITCNCRRSMELLPDPADHPAFRIEPTAT